MGGIDVKRYLALVLLLALCLAACTPKAPAETAPPPEAGSIRPETPAPVWGEQVFQRDYAGEESNADAPEGVVVSLRFVMPCIENAGENPVWQSLNEDFSILGEGWLEKGLECSSTPGPFPATPLPVWRSLRLDSARRGSPRRFRCRA